MHKNGFKNTRFSILVGWWFPCPLNGGALLWFDAFIPAAFRTSLNFNRNIKIRLSLKYEPKNPEIMNRFLVYLFAAFYGLTQAQGVLISNQAGLPDSSAILELADTTKGFLPTRLTTNQRNAISNPAEGLIIFNTDSKCFEGKTP